MSKFTQNVFVINISPENLNPCIEAHIFGLRKGARRRLLNKDDLFLVRRTGRDYGVIGIWFLAEEKEISNMLEVPWTDAEYNIKLSFEPAIDFHTPMSEEFSGTSKYSEKIGLNAMRIVGSIVQLNQDEINSYFNAILQEKTRECSSMVVYRGENVKVADILSSILTSYEKTAKKDVFLPPEKRERDMPVGEPINFRGMVYAPLNEAGVVLLFSKAMDDLGIIYESSPLTGFDMVGRQKTSKGYQRKHFEFEYRSSNFKTHGHDPSEVDYLVCWEHDWIHCPKDLEVIELKEVIKGLPAEFGGD